MKDLYVRLDYFDPTEEGCSVNVALDCEVVGTLWIPRAHLDAFQEGILKGFAAHATNGDHKTRAIENAERHMVMVEEHMRDAGQTPPETKQ